MSKTSSASTGRSPSLDRRRAVREEQQRQAAAAKRRRRMVQIGIVAGVAVLVIAIVASAVILGQRGRSKTAGGPTANTTVTVDNVSVPFAVDGSAVRLGPTGAKAQVDLWVDYSCPHCQEFEAANNAALNQLVAGGDVSVSYHNMQVDTDYAANAGSAAACVAAADPEHWVAFNASLYANHSADTDEWAASDFRTFAAQQGVNATALDCIAASRYTGWIASNTVESAQHQVTGTPTMILNGEKTDTLTGQALISRVNQLAGH